MAIACAVAGLLAVPVPAQAASRTPTYYVSLGDSYAAGYQPGLGATSGGPEQTAPPLAAETLQRRVGGAQCPCRQFRRISVQRAVAQGRPQARGRRSGRSKVRGGFGDTAGGPVPDHE